MVKKHEFEKAVTEQFLDQMSNGTAPWQQPLAVGETRPVMNGFNGFAFNGANSLILQMQNRDDSRFVDFNAAQQMNLKIAKGSKGVVLEDFQTSEKKPVLTKDGEPVLDADGKETFKYEKLERPILRYKHFFNASDIENIGENTFKAESLPKGVDKTGVQKLLLESSAKLDMTGQSGEARLELARYMSAAKYGTGFEPTSGLDLSSEFQSDNRAVFRAARDASYIVDHALGDNERKLTIEKHVAANIGRALEKEEALKNREYIQVSFEEKGVAKELGANWDGKEKSWYIPAKADQNTREALLAKFEAGKIEREPSMTPHEAFGQFLTENGVKLKGEPIMDGEHHRVAVEGDTGKKMSGSYRGFADGRANGQLTNFKSGSEVPIKWEHTGQEMSSADKALIAEQAKANRESNEKLRIAAQDKATRIAFGIYANAENAHPQHGYIQSKGITDQNTLVGVKAGKSGDLIVPVRSLDGKLSSVQFVKPDGGKFFQKGGAIKGGMHIVGDYKAVRKGEAPKILIAEGFATAATLYEATKLPVVVAFNSGNLQPVAESVREANPRASLIIAADNDIQTEQKTGLNVGRDKAFEAAQASGAKVIVPLFNTDEASKGMTDWNDLASSRGDISNTVQAAIDKVSPNRSKHRESGGMEMA